MTTMHRLGRSTTIDERDERHGMRLKKPGSAERESTHVDRPHVDNPNAPGGGLPSRGAGTPSSSVRLGRI